jgi:hypothetical protein
MLLGSRSGELSSQNFPSTHSGGNERLGSNIQTPTTPALMFRALLTKECTPRLELVRTQRSGSCTYAPQGTFMGHRYVYSI